ncbi:sugar kinase [Algoriphagus zhangzhouensis]|uniref:2-dehydro-3-deoxygluconokinase n=1 Tax=Algoriphagus zhangzhouensis TaxID=1073327 RepID=A0A1M7Z679_9BACT|nr:sugar kinase [Algoriphagus zhangzhouensis]TDY48911.1 2-dehydro-3-deoxygluconokinase [Algoriphagus zhangzhouensis]SHO60146.1 2-dehydro-3-deoxygluconokinase [Algoriphagus zhangzhouensis]
MKKIITLGEVMLRLSPPGNSRFAQTDEFHVEFGGSEANVGSALAYWGESVSHVTAFPDHELGKRAAAQLRQNGISTEYVKFLPGRLGVYFLENGALQRSSKIIYDRFDSSFSQYDGSETDWDEEMKSVSWVHWSGISPAISQQSADLTKRILKAARSQNIPVSGDLNYRSNLWQYGKKAHEIMPELMELTTVMIAGARDFSQCLNKDFDSFEEAKTYAFETFKDLKYISKTNRITRSASDNAISGELYTAYEVFSSQNYDVNPIIDRVGTGDAYAAGLIYGLQNLEPQEAIEFALASGVLKHSVPGDILLSSKEEVEEVAAGTSGKIKR